MFPNNRRYTENRTKSDLPSSFILEYQNDELMIMFTLLYVQVLSRAVSTVLEDIKIVLSTKRKPVALLLILFIIISSRRVVVCQQILPRRDNIWQCDGHTLFS